MQDKDIRDLVSGGALVLMGVAIALHSYAALGLGTLRQMGPGMFPFALGILMVICGASIFAAGMRTSIEPLRLPLREPGVVILSIALFAIVVPFLGLIPAVFVLVVVSTLAEGRVSAFRMLVLGVVVSALCYLLFAVFLNLTMPMFAWRF